MIPIGYFNKFNVPVRYQTAAMIFGGSFVLFMIRSNLSIIIIGMTKEFNWNNHDQHLLLGAYFLGYIWPNLIGGRVAEKYGGKIVIFGIFVASTIITIFTALTTSKNLRFFFVGRFLLGVCGGFFFCACHNLISHWAPPTEKGKFISCLLGSKLGIAVTWPLMAWIVDEFNWRVAFHTTAIFSLIFAISWNWIVYDSPKNHPRISKSEKQEIEDSIDFLSKNHRICLNKMLKSIEFYAYLFIHFSDVWGVFFLLTSAPLFANNVLKFNLKHSAFYSILPHLLRLTMGLTFACVGDQLVKNGANPTKIRKYFCIFSHIIPGLILISFLIFEMQPITYIILITLSLGFNGASVMTSSQCPQDLAPNSAATVFGIANFFATMSGFLSPMVVSYFTREKNSMNEWREIFFFDGFLYISTAIFFMIFGSAEAQKWNKKDSLLKIVKI